MNELERPDKIIAGAAALSICESLLISLQELKIISGKEACAVLVDAAATHRNAIPVSPNGDEHRVIAELIERLIETVHQATDKNPNPSNPPSVS